MATTANLDQIYSVLYSDIKDPFSVLGGHELTHDGKKVVSVRAYEPEALSVSVVDGSSGKEYVMEKVHKEGFFERFFLDRDSLFPYKLKKVYEDGSERIDYDPYSFPPVISEEDLYLYNKGDLHYAYNSLGAHRTELEGVEGFLFAVWAPNARRVSVVGDFNSWDGRHHMMRQRGSSGVWEIFIPGLPAGEVYKYEIFSQKRQIFLKMDPYAFRTEEIPHTGVLTYNIDKYEWSDGEWLRRRGGRDFQKEPVSIYEVHLGSWMRTADGENNMLSYRELAHKLVDYVKEMGYTHIELLPIAEHPFGGSWGYQVSGYYAPTSRFGEPEDFMYFVDHCHRNDIAVIMDWVPAHFPKDAHGLAWFDGTCLYEHMDPRKGEHRDWGTLIFNYGRAEVQNFLLSNALFWLDKYHIDGLRIDAVASMLYLDYSRNAGEWIPNKYGGRENLEAIELIKHVNEVVGRYYPNAMMMAEESTAWPRVSAPVYLGGLGFGYKWNMGWMNDMLSYISKDPIYRKYHQNTLTFSILYAFTENFVLPLSHDEVVHGKGSMLTKMPGDMWEKFANLRTLYAYMFAHPGKKLLFQGGDIGQWSEWNHDASVDWHLLRYEPHYKLNRFVRDLLHLYRNEPALYEVDFSYEGFEWLDFNDWENSMLSFMRKDGTGRQIVVAVFNFTPVTRRNYRIGVPYGGFYREIFNSDAEIYGGANVGNIGGVWAEEHPVHQRAFSISLSVPPCGALYFKYELPEPTSAEEPVFSGEETQEKEEEAVKEPASDSAEKENASSAPGEAAPEKPAASSAAGAKGGRKKAGSRAGKTGSKKS